MVSLVNQNLIQTTPMMFVVSKPVQRCQEGQRFPCLQTRRGRGVGRPDQPGGNNTSHSSQYDFSYFQTNLAFKFRLVAFAQHHHVLRAQIHHPLHPHLSAEMSTYCFDVEWFFSFTLFLSNF